MQIASWNVNSLKVRLPHVLQWLQDNQADVLGLQETKMTDEVFPVQAIESAGYRAVFSGEKAYNGVALISKNQATNITTDIPQFNDPQRRLLSATINGVRIINLYVVNGKAVDDNKYHWKLHWLEQVGNYIEAQIAQYERLVVIGDFNIAPADADIHDPKLWQDKILCSAPERKALQRLFALGLTDTFRLFTQPQNSFSWWDYRAGSFRRNHGLRIDLILSSPSMTKLCTSSTIDPTPRRLQRPSDHAPVVAQFSI